MAIFKFFTKKSVLVCLGVLAFLAFIPAEAWAQPVQSNVDTGPFKVFLLRAAKLFMQTRNALFVLAAFAFIAYAWQAIQSGSVDWKKIFFLICGLVILGVAGWIVSYMANPEDANRNTGIYSQFEDIQDTKGW